MTTLSVKTQKTLTKFFRTIGDLELSVEAARCDLARLYDFEPYAAFCRIDQDGDGHIYTRDFYNFLRENNVTQFSMKDCQLMMQFYDIDGSGQISYEEFMKFALPVDHKELRSECCQRTTYKVDAKAGKRMYPSVEEKLSAYMTKEIGIHLKMEMLKRSLGLCPDWDTKAAFKIIDSQSQGYVSHPQVYSFLNSNGHDASDEELVAIIRRIDGSGNGSIDYNEFALVCEPILLRMTDIIEVEDQGDFLRKQTGQINEGNARPFLKKTPAPQQMDMLNKNNNVDLNLQIYDQMQSMNNSTIINSPPRHGQENPEASFANASPFQLNTAAKREASSPLRHDVTQSPYPLGNQTLSSPMPARGGPLADMTNMTTLQGAVPLQNVNNHVGPLNLDDERALVQVLFDMIMQETAMERQKQSLAEQSDFNLMDGFQMMDEKNLGWIAAPQVLQFLIINGVFAHKDDVYHFARRFDRDMDSKLLYSDFCEAFTPKDTYYQHALHNRKGRYIHNKSVPKKLYFSDQTRDTFFMTLKKHFEVEETVELSKKKLWRRPTIDIHDAFSCVDEQKRGSLVKDDFRSIMEKNGFHPSDVELNYLVSRFDRSLNGIINYQEFMDEILPRKSLLGEVASINLLRKQD